jgi:anaerobic ribonucleoside-triphosphate reductase
MPITRIKKRDGRTVDFDATRIRDAIHKALIAVELEDGERAEYLTKEIVKLLESRFVERIPSVEDAQDAVVEVLGRESYEKVAQEYQA